MSDIVDAEILDGTEPTTRPPIYRSGYRWLMSPVDSYTGRPLVLVGDIVVALDPTAEHGGTGPHVVTAVYLESVELSTGDQVPVTDLMLWARP